MHIVIPGGTGQVGTLLAKALLAKNHQVTTIGRSPVNDALPCDHVQWDGKGLGAWASCFDGADVIVNLAGRSVNCRYTEENLKAMMDSRVDSTAIVGEAIGQSASPPALWLQMSTATIYAHRFDAANDEHTGIIGGEEEGVPAYWARSIAIAKAWEQTQIQAATPKTRKVALRTSMVMSPDDEGIFDVLLSMVRRRLGGSIAGGRQYMSWIHDEDFVRAIEFLIEHEDMSGAVNLAAPNPLPQGEFMGALRAAAGVGLGLPATAWMAKLGAIAMRTDTELLLKSRRVVPSRLLDAGFVFSFPSWPEAAIDLLARQSHENAIT
jgi:uncharacterized protein (TIGR01777 family)